MPKDESNIVWLDMEMTGLEPSRDRILEIAVLVTNADLDVVAEGPNLVVHQREEVLAGMDAWNTEHHTASGLVERVLQSTLSEADAENQLLEFVRALCPERKCPLAGNSIHQDRRFLYGYMPRFEAYLHYRMIDVSTIKELTRRWYPKVFAEMPAKKSTHRAQGDIRESIDELRRYREHIFR